METKDEQFELCSQNLNKQQVLQQLLTAPERLRVWCEGPKIHN